MSTYNGEELSEQRLLTLFDDIAFGDSSEEKLSQLETLVEQDPGVAASYLRYVSLHVDLECVLQTENVRERLHQQLLSANEVRNNRRQSVKHIAWGVFALAASFALLASYVLLPSGGEPTQSAELINEAESLEEPVLFPKIEIPSGAAVITSFDGDLESAAKPARVGDHLLCGNTISLRSGTLTLLFHDGATAVLTGSSKLELNSPSSATLHSGKLVADVPPWAIGFHIDTPQMRVVDHGTRFAISVDDSDAVEVAVAEGEVELRSVGDSTDPTSGKRLYTGDSVRSTNGLLVDEDKDSQLANLTSLLPERISNAEVEMVAGYQTDFLSSLAGESRTEGSWRYLYNARSQIGDPAGYVDLKWQQTTGAEIPGRYDANGQITDFADEPARRVSLWERGGHPGGGRFQSRDFVDRYVIAAYIVPQDGSYQVESGWLSIWESERHDMTQAADLVVHVNDDPFLIHEYVDRPGFLSFRGDLGHLKSGDAVYFCVGPNGYAWEDRFIWGFKIVRALEPALE